MAMANQRVRIPLNDNVDSLNVGNAAANNAINTGNARSSGYAGTANAVTNALGQITGYASNAALDKAVVDYYKRAK